MASILQIRANRLNAQLSTGPRSVEGKAVSRFNALKSGIDAGSQVIEGESAEELAALTAEYIDRFQPRAPEERALVDILINDEWLLRRFRTVEARLVQFEISTFLRPDTETNLARAYDNSTDKLARLQRRIDATKRSLHQSLAALKKLQSDRDPEPPAAVLSAPNPVEIPNDSQPETTIGFVPPSPGRLSTPEPQSVSQKLASFLPDARKSESSPCTGSVAPDRCGIA